MQSQVVGDDNNWMGRKSWLEKSEHLFIMKTTALLVENLYIFITLSKTTILDPSKLIEFADGNFKFDDNGRKFSRWVENTLGKGEIACYKQFLLFPQCFQKTCTADT